MTLALLEFDPNRLAAILYSGDDDVDALLSSFATELERAGQAVAAGTAAAVGSAVTAKTGLIVIGKFAKQQAADMDLRSEITTAVAAGRAVLTAVPETCIGDWKDFTGDRGTTLFCARHVVDAWWLEISTREASARGAQ